MSQGARPTGRCCLQQESAISHVQQRPAMANAALAVISGVGPTTKLSIRIGSLVEWKQVAFFAAGTGCWADRSLAHAQFIHDKLFVIFLTTERPRRRNLSIAVLITRIVPLEMLTPVRDVPGRRDAMRWQAEARKARPRNACLAMKYSEYSRLVDLESCCVPRNALFVLCAIRESDAASGSSLSPRCPTLLQARQTMVLKVQAAAAPCSVQADRRRQHFNLRQN